MSKEVESVERNALVALALRHGVSPKKIAAAAGISRQRVYQVSEKVEIPARVVYVEFVCPQTAEQHMMDAEEIVTLGGKRVCARISCPSCRRKHMVRIE